MLTIITAMAAAAAAQTAQPAPANPHAQHGPAAGQMDHSQMDHSKTGQHGDGCCVKGADGKMECRMMQGKGADRSGQAHHQGHSGQ